MAKVKITGHASGTGILTVTAPNTSTDRTITLPDATGTLLNSDGDGSSLTGVADATKLPLAGGTMTGALNATNSANTAEIKVGAETAKDFQGYAGIQFDDRGYIGGYPNDSLGIFYNTYHSSGSKAIDTAAAANIQLINSGIRFQTAASVSADAAQTMVDRLMITTAGLGVSQFTSAGWFLLNGTGTISVDDSYNISSIDDRGTGHYECNWDRNMSNENYSVVGNSGQYAGSINPITRYVASYAFKSFNDGAAATDDANIMLMAFGDS